MTTGSGGSAVSEGSDRSGAWGNQRLAVLASDTDVELINRILRSRGVDSVALSAPELIDSIGSGNCAAAIIAAEILSPADVLGLEEAARLQPSWPDFPIVLVGGRDALNEGLGLLQAIGQLSIVERPIHPPVLINAAQAALRSRARQREAEAYLLQRERAEEHLRQLTSTLEKRVRERMSDIRAANKQLLREARERQAAEERLRESEELYRYTVELSQQLAWTAAADGTIISISPRFHRITGLDETLPPQEGWMQALHPDDMPATVREWQRAITQAVPTAHEFRMRIADGSYRMFRARAAPRFGEDGRVYRWYGYTEDIEEQNRAEAAREQAEERLRESEELHRYTLELSEQIAWTAQADGAFLTISPRFTEITGCPMGPLSQAMMPDEFEVMFANWRRAVELEEPYEGEFRLRVVDGSYRRFQTRAAPRRNPDGKIIRWYGTTEDIHDKKEAELARLEAEERYRMAARATNDAIWDLNFTTDQILWNDSDAPVFGYPITEGATDFKWWEDKLHPADRERVSNGFSAAIAAGENRWSAAYQFRTASGGYADIFDRGFFIRDEEGRAVRAVGAMTDVTERRRADTELRQVQAELIHVSRLSAMGAMASTLAHELNQPLTAVANYVQGSRRLLAQAEGQAGPPVLEALEAAEEASLRAGQIVRKLRELVSRGNVSPEPEELPKLIEDANLIAFVDEHLHGVTHRSELDPGAVWVNVDRIQIQQVLINLVRNAIQSMHDQPRREVTIRTRVAPDSMVEVSVADTGAGIRPDVREALFSPFKSTKAEGLGIGLSISRTIIEAHHGKIWAEDGEEGGAVFRFTLPRIEAPREPEAGS
jgi:PAS domain S-box-containing protein